MLGDTEVQNFDLSFVGKHDIFRLDVAVNNALLVGGYQSFGALDGDGEEFVQGQRLAQALTQVLAFHILQNQEYLALLFKNIVDSGDVRIAEAGCAFGFFEKTMAVKRVRAQGGRETLQCDGALKSGVLCAVDLTHTAFAKSFADAEAPDDGAGQGLLWLDAREKWLKIGHRRLVIQPRESVPRASRTAL